MNENILYDFHHSLDPIILNVANKIFTLKSLSKAKEHYNIDFLNDIGIINLLRKRYLDKGNVGDIFYFYQNTRLDDKSHRYESLFATMIITIIGTVVGGIILEIYKDNKDKVLKFIKREIIERAIDYFDNNKHMNKFNQINADDLYNDFKKIRRCYNGRSMLERGLISYEDYKGLLFKFLQGVQLAREKEGLINAFEEFENKQLEKKDEINENKIFDVIKIYSKGITYQFLDEEGMTIPDDPRKCSYIIRGIGASLGYAHAVTIFFDPELNIDYHKNKYILIIDSKLHKPEYIDIIVDSEGVVTWNCGKTGHIPVICRGMRKACVIINEEDLIKIPKSSLIEIDGGNGLIRI